MVDTYFHGMLSFIVIADSELLNAGGQVLVTAEISVLKNGPETN